MKTWWQHTPIWQRLVLLGLAMVLWVLGMHTWVWSPLDQGIERLTVDIAGLNQKNQLSLKRIASLKHVEQEVALLREKLSPHIQQLPIKVAPRSFRRDIVHIGKRTGVVLRLWKPKKSLMAIEHSEAALDIVVKVEGSFHGTAQFLDELLQVSWIQAVNPLVLTRKLETVDASIITTDFTIHVLTARDIQQVTENRET